MINRETQQNPPTSPIITENENQLKQLQKWVAYGDEFLNGENSEKNISDLKSKLVSNTILVFNLKKGQFEVVSARKYLDDYFLFGTSQNLSERSDEEIHQELRSEFYSFTDTLKKMNLIISKLDTNNVDYRFVLVYYIKLLRHLPFRKRGLVNFSLLEKLYQKISKDEELKKSLGSPIVSSINDTWELLNPSKKEDARNKTVHKLVSCNNEKILKIERGLLSPDTSLFPNLIFVYTSKLYDGDVIHYYKTE